MKIFFNRLKGKLDSSLRGLAYSFVKGRDYKLLNNYILKITSLRDIEEILLEASFCLKDVLNYELFSFAYKNNTHLDIWINPRYPTNGSFIQKIKNDLACQSIDTKINTFNWNYKDKYFFNERFNENKVLSFPVKDGQERARLYILSKDMLLSHQKELVEIIIKVMGAVLDNYLSRKELETLVIIDPLTSCYNRRTLKDLLSREVSKAQRYIGNLSVLMIDIDHFKSINDCYGHIVGDYILKELSRIIEEMIRKSDYIVRFGGEEFVVVLPEISMGKAVSLSKRIKSIIEKNVFYIHNKAIKMTISIGVSTFNDNKTSYELLKEADDMLYISKNNGRNRIAFYSEDEKPYCFLS